jgi:hypothetical protein
VNSFDDTHDYPLLSKGMMFLKRKIFTYWKNFFQLTFLRIEHVHHWIITTVDKKITGQSQSGMPAEQSYSALE